MGTSTYNGTYKDLDNTQRGFPAVDENGYQYVKTEINGVGDIEIAGEKLLSATGTTSTAAADVTIKDPGGSDTIRVYRVSFISDADITAVVLIKIGSTTIHRERNPRKGVPYGFNIAPDYFDGAADGDKLLINISAGSFNIDFNAAYKLV